MRKKLIALSLLFASVASLSGCNKETPSYEITILNKHGVGVSNVSLTLGDTTIATNEKGVATFSIKKGEYDVSFSELPLGYSNNEPLSVSEYGKYQYVLDSEMIETAPKRGTIVDIGDLMYDYTFTVMENEVVDGVTSIKKEDISLKEKLKENDFLVINCFYVTCSACVLEAPFISAAYNDYKDCSYMIGIDNPDASQADSYITNCKDKEGLTFDVAYDKGTCSKIFDLVGYPTTLIVDRYGFICFSFCGGITSKDELTSVFETFKGENYEPIFYHKNSFTPM